MGQHKGRMAHGPRHTVRSMQATQHPLRCCVPSCAEGSVGKPWLLASVTYAAVACCAVKDYMQVYQTKTDERGATTQLVAECGTAELLVVPYDYEHILKGVRTLATNARALDARSSSGADTRVVPEVVLSGRGWGR